MNIQFAPNTLYYGDCLDILSDFPDNCSPENTALLRKKIIMDNQHPVRLPSTLLELPQVIAARQWFRAIKIESLASHLDISEDEVRAAINSPEYVEAVGNLMLTTQSPANIRKWIETYPRSEMSSKFGERMGLSETVVSELIEKVLDRLSSGE